MRGTIRKINAAYPHLTTLRGLCGRWNGNGTATDRPRPTDAPCAPAHVAILYYAKHLGETPQLPGSVPGRGDSGAPVTSATKTAVVPSPSRSRPLPVRLAGARPAPPSRHRGGLRATSAASAG